MVLLFALTLFVGSTLLFLIEPMFAKMVLPLLGGTPAVWNTCMVFFQLALLGGYAYAHFSASRLNGKRQVPIHVALVLLPLAFLPIHIATNATPPLDSNPIPWLLGVLSLSAGIPFFVVSSTAPTIQRWFAQAGHAESKDPYFLYAASNLGSVAGLLGYLAVFEPHFTLAQQSRIWTIGYLLLLALTAGCAGMVWRSRGKDAKRAPESKTKAQAASDRTPLGSKLRWIGLSAIPSSLMIGVTTHLTTDIASVPLLWVVPLALYLLTFSIAFSRRALVPVVISVCFLPAAIIGNIVILTGLLLRMPWLPALHLGTFFLTAMACHGILAQERPPAHRLTEYYMLVSVGGAVGGLFNGLIAPVTFSWVAEYPLALIAAFVMVFWPYAKTQAEGESFAQSNVPRPFGVLILILTGIYALYGIPACMRLLTGHEWTTAWRCVAFLAGSAVGIAAVLHAARYWPRPTETGAESSRPPMWYIRAAMPILIGVVALVIVTVYPSTAQTMTALRLTLAVIALASFALFQGPVRFEIALTALLLSVWSGNSASLNIIHQERSFFGVVRIVDVPQEGVRRFMHGTTLHGLQLMAPSHRADPLSYYSPSGPIGQLVRTVGEMRGPSTIGVLGLGAGAIAAYARPGDSYEFFEIDPAVVRIASDPRYFTFLTDARARGAHIGTRLGDARLVLRDTPDGRLDLLLMDAFSSDSIPVHLLTKQAIATYLPKMKPHGIIAIHITNRYLDLEQTVADIAGSLGLKCMYRGDTNLTLEDMRRYKAASRLMILARAEADFGPLVNDPEWQPVAPNPADRVWTDDYSNILDVVMWSGKR